MFKGLFNRMYNGNPNRQDIDPEDMPRNKFELFFTTLGVRFGDLIKINMLYVVFILPALAWTVFNVMALLTLQSAAGTTESAMAQFAEQLISLVQVYLLGMIPCLALAGPPSAGLVYVTRNWARDEHAWLWGDFKEQTLKNWKQSALVGGLVGVVLYIALITVNLYDQLKATAGWIWGLQLVFVLLVGLLVLSLMYAFPMLVTYKVKFTQLVRNSVMLALGRLPFTLLFGALTVFPLVLGLVIAMYTLYAVLGIMIYYAVIGFALSMFVINSYTNATFDRLLKTEEDEPAPEEKE